MSRPIAPGSGQPVPFTLAEVPDSPPTVVIYRVDPVTGTLSEVTANVGAAVVRLGTTRNYHVYFTAEAAGAQGDWYQILLSVVVGGETTTHWLDGGTVELWASQASLDDVAAGVAALAALDNITVASPVDLEGAVTVRRSRDYDADDGRALDWINAAGTWPDLTDATFAVLVARPGKTVALYSFAGSVVTPTGAGQTVRLELTDAQLAINADDYVYEGKATLASGNVVDLPGVSGPFSVLLGRDEPA